MKIEPVKTNFNVTKSATVMATRVLTIFFIFAIYILSDFVGAKGGSKFVTDGAYWVKTIVNLVLIIATMLTVRLMRRDKKIAESVDINNNMLQIEKGFKKITVSGLSEKLELYLDKLNDDAKYDKFIKTVQAKLIRLKNNEKGKAQRIELNNLLQLPREEVLQMDIKYNRVTFSKLFASIDGRIVNEDENDLNTYEKQSVAKMVSTKSLMVFLFSAFSTSIALDIMYGGTSVIFGALIKIFSLLLSINTAMNTADDYVNHNLKTSINRRFKILANFVNSEPGLNSVLKNEPNKLYEKIEENKIAEVQTPAIVDNIDVNKPVS